MVRKVEISTKENGKYSICLDGLDVSEAVNGLTLFMEGGSVPHLMLHIPFGLLSVDGVEMDVTSTSYEHELRAAEELDEDIQHVGYDDAQCGREK